MPSPDEYRKKGKVVKRVARTASGEKAQAEETGASRETQEQGEKWLDSNTLVVEEEMPPEVVKEWDESELVSFQAEEDVGLWDMSSVSTEIDREEETGVITYDNVRVVGVDGMHEVDYDGTTRYDAHKEVVEEVSEKEFLVMERRKSEEVRRNRGEYRMYCPSCRNDLRCRGCRGKGRHGILRRSCKDCGGSGRCPVCGGEFEVPCSGCGKTISGYSTSCRHCGRSFRCPKCLQPLPLMATRCIYCKKSFICKLCKEPIPVGSYTKCPKCGKEL